MADAISCEDTLYEVYFLKSPTSFTQRCSTRRKRSGCPARERGNFPISGLLAVYAAPKGMVTRFGQKSGLDFTLFCHGFK